MKWMWRKYFKVCLVYCRRCLTSRDVQLAPTYISTLPTLFVQFTSAIKLSPSQRTHGTLSCCAALIETAKSITSKIGWEEPRRGKKPNKTQHQRVAAEEILSRDLRCLVTLKNCVFHVNASHVCCCVFFLCRLFFSQNVPR